MCAIRMVWPARSSRSYDPALKGELERRAYDYGKEMAWPNVGRRVLALTRELLEPQPVSSLLEPVDTESPVQTA